MQTPQASHLFRILLFSTIGLVYLFFPSNNLSIDSLAYGANVKYSTDLFHAHHLLYNYFNWLLYKGVSFLCGSVDALRLMQCCNGLFALASIYLLYRIILKQTNDKNKAGILALFTGSCFGLMRFAVEAETYIIPVFFSLAASMCFLHFLKVNKKRYIVASSVLISIACLFHQIHLFWGIALFIGFFISKNWKAALLFLLPTLIVPITYACVLSFYMKEEVSLTGLVYYLGEYYHSDSADTSIGLINFIMTPISFFRTFFQVHGNIPHILKLIPFIYAFIPVVLIFIFLSCKTLWKTVKIQRSSILRSPFEFSHLLAFILQLGFAFYSHGNAEFMIMLPFLLTIFLFSFINFDLRAIQYMMCAMLIWNFFFAIYPDHRFDYQNNKALVALIEKHPNQVFVLKERHTLINLYYYETGQLESDRILDILTPSGIAKLQENQVVYTDVLSKKMPFSRAQVVSSEDYSNLVFIQHIEWIPSTLGGFYVDEAIYKP